jgi:hypothetical protein
MVREFVDVVDTYRQDDDGDAVTFAHQPGSYVVRPRPPDVRDTLRGALHSGRPLRVTVDTVTFVIDDAVVA